MLRRLIWIGIIAGLGYAGYQWLFVVSQGHPERSPRGVMNSFAEALLEDNVAVMHSVCRGEAAGQINDLRAALATRRQRGAPIIQLSLSGNTGGVSGHAQGLLMATDRTGNTLPLWDIYVMQDDAGRWWVARFTLR
jgi:hypothetical protein